MSEFLQLLLESIRNDTVDDLPAFGAQVPPPARKTLLDDLPDVDLEDERELSRLKDKPCPVCACDFEKEDVYAKRLPVRCSFNGVGNTLTCSSVGPRSASTCSISNACTNGLCAPAHVRFVASNCRPTTPRSKRSSAGKLQLRPTTTTRILTRCHSHLRPCSFDYNCSLGSL